MPKLEAVPYWRLSVTVLRAELHHSQDYWSQSDCYVILRLPTSSARSHRTKTVPNSDKPEWNETVHFRIHSHVKNVLEMKMYDDDPCTRDDLISVLLFDISNLTLGQKQTHMFILNKEGNNKLWVEFEMVETSEDPGKYLSNGVLVAAPFSTLEVTAKHLGTALENLMLKLKGAYKEDQVLTNGQMDSLRYYINRDLETELSVQGDETVQPINLSPDPLSPVTPKKELTFTFPIGKEFVDLELKSEERLGQELGVRLDFDISPAEKQFLEKRKVVVGRALQKLLQLSSPPHADKVPLVGVVCSGGGTRAMTGTFGSLKGLQTLGILDAVSYMTGVSGSTWAMSILYENPDWSQGDLSTITEPMKNEMIKRYQHFLSTDQLSNYLKGMKEKEKEGHSVTYIDMWGLVIEHLVYGKKWESILSDQQRAVSAGQNPLPIYTCVNSKTKDAVTAPEWCEFNPFEVGLPKYGAFVPTEDFGSEYFLGYQVNKLPETRLPFLIGIWSSVFSVSLADLWHHVTGYSPSWLGGDVTNTETDSEPSTLDTYLMKPASSMIQRIGSFFTSRPVVSQIYNLIRGLYLHWDYNSKSGFNLGQAAHPDAFPNQMTPADTTLNLVDAAFYCNVGIPPILRDHRCMDLILTFNYSWDTDQFEVLKNTQKHCDDHRILFPHIDFSRVEKEPLKEVYVFEDENNPKTPIVVHFPMVNLSFREFKAPGVKREGADELKQGDVDVSTKKSPYLTTTLAYQPEDFQKLMDLTYYNVLNNRDLLLSALHKALQRERPCPEQEKCCL